jgi:hypothetical protein
MMAANQCFTRPRDERFWNLKDLLAHTTRQKEQSVVKEVNLNDLRVIDDDGTIKVGGQRNGNGIEMTSWAFEQLCQRVGLGAVNVKTMVAWGKGPEVASVLSEGLKRVRHTNAAKDDLDPIQQVLVDGANGLVRAFNGQGYGRLWSADIVRNMIMPLQSEGWRTPPARPLGRGSVLDARPATADDVLVYADGEPGMGLSVKIGDLIAPAGLYAGVEDMWVIQVNCDRRIETGTGAGLYRALVFINSEVGSSKYRVMAIGFDSICGNHILWGAKVLGEVAIIHRGDKVSERALSETLYAARTYLDMPASVEENAILAARAFTIGKDEEAVVTRLFAKNIASRRTLYAAYEKAVEFESDHKAAPNTAWGMACGLTRVSQDDDHANGRAATDGAASRVLEMAA